MNPGVLVAGGGAGSGGDGPGDGSAGTEKDGANPEKGGANADADGKSAGACGKGTPGGCTNCSSKAAAGDPVDVVTGEVFTIPKTDLYLPGFFNLMIDRTYATRQVERDCGLGWGWRHTLAWELRVERGGVILRDGEGRTLEFPPMETVGSSVSRGAWAILRTEEGYLVRPGDEFMHRFAPDAMDPNVYRLVAISFRNRGHVRLEYDRGRLVRVIDTAARAIVFAQTPEGRIASISVPDPKGRTIVFARYSYSSAGDLISATDADGHTTRYVYDGEHRLLELRLPTDLTFHFKYDSQGRCVETWGDRPGGDPALARDVTAYLADGRTRAKGIYHCKLDFVANGESTVDDSVRVTRFTAGPHGKVARAASGTGGVTSRTFDADGNETSHTNPLGATFVYAYDGMGQLVRETDPEGHTVSLERDREGRVVSVVDAAGGVVTGERNEHGDIESIVDQRGGVTTYAFDLRGMTTDQVDPRGARTSFAYDGHGNCVERTMPNGGTYRFTYDYWGRTLTQRDPLGYESRWDYSDRGDVVRVTDAAGRTKLRELDGLGNLVAITTPDGLRTRFEYGGLNWHCRTILPAGDEVKWEYNREGWVVRVVNEKGETQELEHNSNGLITEERQFTGAVHRYGYDLMNRLVWFDDGHGKTELVRNLLGQVVEQIAPDDATKVYEYDARGEMTAARLPDVELLWERDPTGDVVRETQKIGEATYVVESALDPGGRRTKLRTSLGHELDIRRDALGDVVEMWSGEQLAMRYERDAFGWPIRRDLGRGGSIVDTYDEVQRLRRREVRSLGAKTAVGESEPDWIGARSGQIAKAFQYTPIDEIAEVASSEEGVVTFEYDVRRHLLAKKRDGAVEESFKVDAASNYYETGPRAEPRVYGDGSKLLRRGATEYVYDDRGFLVEKRRSAHAGASLDTWRYTWGPFNLLQSVALPDGRRVEFQYDAFARRMAKRVAHTNAFGDDEVLSATHYVWDKVNLLHEVETRLGTDRAFMKTYLFENNEEGIPLGQRDGASGIGDWQYFVGDVGETPEEIVDATGARVGRMQRDAFGRTVAAAGSLASTRFRFTGQYADEETGLHYNRYRYYDPEIGRYISPDPIGIDGGLNLYGYGPNPIGWFDPMGWIHTMTVVSAVDSKNRPLKTPKKDDVYQSGQGDCGEGKQYPDEYKNQAKCHTERKLVHDLAQNSPAALKGSKVTVEGTFPPCPNCHRAMMKMASENGMKSLKYQWKDEHGNMQSMTYPGKDGKPTPTGSNAENLAKSYAMTKDEGPLGYKFDNYGAKDSDASAAGQYAKQRDAILNSKKTK